MSSPRLSGLPLAATGILIFCLISPSRAELRHRWSFGGADGPAAAGTVLTDSVGGAVARVQGNNARFEGNTIVIRGANGGDTTTGERSAGFISSYIDLPNGLISSKTDLTLELWATPLTARNYMRVFDFGRMNTGFGGGAPGEVIDQFGTGQHPVNSNASDCLMLSFAVGTDLATQRLETRLGGATVSLQDSALPTTAGTRYHYVMTFEDRGSGGRVAWFRDGVRVAASDVPFRLSDIRDVNNWLGRSQWSGDMLAHASYDELRIYDHVLSDGQIAANTVTGPDGILLPDPPAADHVWNFTTPARSGAPSGTTFTDIVGGETATLRGRGGSLSGSAVILPGTTTGDQSAASISAYLDLPNGIITRSPSITVEAWASPLSSRNWQRLFDFGRCAASHGAGAEPGEIIDGTTAPGGTSGHDNLSLTFNNGGNLNSQQLEGQIDGAPPQYTFSTAATVPGTTYHYALVAEDTPAGCQARWYRDGALQNTMNFAFKLTDISDVNNWIGRSMYSGDSNSHLSLDELRIYRKALTAGEIRASQLAGPDPSSGPPEPPAPLPVPTRRWDFNAAAGSAPAGTVFTDRGTGEVITVRGQGATTDGSAVRLPSAATNGNQSAANISAYLALPAGLVSSRPSLSLEAWVTPLSSKNWQRLFDFGSTSLTYGTGARPGQIVDGAAAPGNFVARDNLFLSLNNGGTLGSHRLEAKLGGESTVTSNTDLSSATTAGTRYHIVLTVEDGAGAGGASGCLVTWYRDGVAAGSVDLPYRLPDLSDVNNWIGRSMWAADSNGHFALDELRLHDRALTLREIATSHSAGPDAVFAPPSAIADHATVHGGQKVLVDVLTNDGGTPLPATLEISSPPATGAAVVRSGAILFTHGGESTDPVTFRYRVRNVSGAASEATVTVTTATSLRVPNPALAMPAAPPATSWQLVDALPGLVFNQPVCVTSIPGDNKRLFVCERMAKVVLVPDVTAAAPVKETFLDIHTVVGGRTPVETLESGINGENGLLGLAFHPQYSSNGLFYAAYTVRIGGGAFYQRVSRFRVNPTNPSRADPASELILIQQLDEGPNHNGGDLHFGPDGYLYYAAGDEENSDRGPLNSQKLDGDFFAGIFRIDVDKKPGNLPPNPHPAIPTDGGIARFSVPVDNPFVHTSLGGGWDGRFRNAPVANLPAIRTEYWAIGLRHVWRMSFDPATGDLWAGDVGHSTYEEVNRIVKGGNYGWGYREGAHNFSGSLGPVPPDFSSIDPHYEYVHNGVGTGDSSLKGNSVVGGYVYRGTRYPSLEGSYVFSDSVSGHVWQMNPLTSAVTRITGLPGAYGVISSQGVDPFQGDLLFAAYLSGKIMRLSTGDAGNTGFPATLSQTGLFADLTDLSPAPGMVPYEPNLPFWSDHAIKTRWFTIPDADSRITWRKDDPWTLPTGMIWVKHFDLETTRGNPATKKRIETRVLVKTDTGTYGVSYRWNEAGTEATLVGESGVDFDLAINDHGTSRVQRWQIPGRANCLTCHTPEAGHSLSFNTRQLNLSRDILGQSGNQIDLLAANDFLANTPDPVAALARHIRPDEADYPLEQRARSYFAVNCSYCHRQGGNVGGFWDGRAELTLEQTGLIRGIPTVTGDDPANRYVVPSDASRSVILHRMGADHGATRMPPLGTTELDHRNLQLIHDWITQELPNRPLYDEWRQANFPAADPAGDRDADPDGDGLSNHEEFLLGTPPRSGTGGWQAALTEGTLRFLRRSHRYYAVETSTDLADWQPWPLPEIDSAYRSDDSVTEIPLPPDGGHRKFFRFRVTEP